MEIGGRKYKWQNNNAYACCNICDASLLSIWHFGITEQKGLYKFYISDDIIEMKVDR